MKRILYILAVMMVMSGCLLIEDDQPPAKGHTACGDFISDGTVFCAPGSYCVDPTFSECRPGCLSNENCAEDQRCVKADGSNLGTCQNQFKIRPEEPAMVGSTECGSEFDGTPSYCQPGSYCANPTFERCVPGCLSDANCYTNELCVKPEGSPTGVCQKP